MRNWVWRAAIPAVLLLIFDILAHGAPPQSGFNPIRVNSAGGAYTDSQGRAWSADTGFSGGTGAVVSARVIGSTVDDVLYQSERWGVFSYSFTVPAGSYLVTLKFVETFFTSGAASGQRVFNVAINGATVLTNFDIKAAAGGANIAVDRTLTVNAGAGSNNLQIQFLHVAGQPDDPKVDAIEIVRGGGNAPTITTQPANRTVTEGQTATFTVSATGTAPLGYQWRKNGADIIGAISATYTTPATTAVDNGGQFSVVVNNSAGSATSDTATLTVKPPMLSTVSMSPASLVGGDASTGTVTLSSPAPAGGAVVTLLSDNAAATVPASATVAEGTATANFPVSTITVGTLTSVTISGSFNGTQAATLTINAPTVSTMSLSPASLVGGDASTGTVTLSSPAPAGGAVVTLLSDNAAATVPASVTVVEGTATANFPVSTITVGTLTSVTISGSFNGTQAATLTINAPTVSTMSLSPASLVGGDASTGTVTLSSPAPAGGAVVTLLSDNAAATVPASATVAEGTATANFPVSTITVGTLTSVTISGSFNGTQAATLTINAPTVSTMSLSPASLVGGDASTGTVTLSSPAPAGGAVVTLLSDNAAATVPASVTVAEGTATADFPVSTIAVGTLASVTISGSFNGTQTATLTVNRAVAPAITTQPVSQTVTAGQAATFSVSATGTAPLGYQWRMNGANISGATSSSYTTSATTAVENGARIRVVVSNSAGSATSNSATLTVSAATRLLSASPTILRFGSVNVGDSSSLASTLTNTGNSNVTVSNVSLLGAGLNVNGVFAGQILAPGEAATLNVTFAPAITGSVTGSVVVASNAGNSPVIVSLLGTAIRLVSHVATLFWSPSSSVVLGYHVYSSTVSGGPYTKLTTVPTVTTSYRDASVQTGRTYYYVVTAVSADTVESIYSNQVSALIP